MSVILRLMSTVFLAGPARLYFTDHIRDRIRFPDEAISMLEDQFLDKRAWSVNDEVWNGLSFEAVKQVLIYEKSPARHTHVLKKILRDIVDLAYMHTGSSHPDDVMLFRQPLCRMQANPTLPTPTWQPKRHISRSSPTDDCATLRVAKNYVHCFPNTDVRTDEVIGVIQMV